MPNEYINISQNEREISGRGDKHNHTETEQYEEAKRTMDKTKQRTDNIISE